MWKGSTVNAFTITIPPGVKVLKITTENTYVNEFVDPNLPRYIGVTGGKTYNMHLATVEEGSIPEPEYWEVQVYRYNSSSGFKQWVGSYYNVLLCKHKRRNSKRFRLLRKKQSEVN